MRNLYQNVLLESDANPAEKMGGAVHRESRTEPELVQTGLSLCKKITKKYGTSFFFATQFFPNEVKQGIYAIYAFARIPDEIVDDPENRDARDALNRLHEWRNLWLRAMRTGETTDPILAAIVFVFEKYGIPVEEGEAFLKSMFMDMDKSRYKTYEELEEYMYGSAGVIGLMVTRIVGYYSDEAFPYAEKLGYAFQLTNFLRDIQEDSEGLGRIYMPINELSESDLEPDDIVNQVYDRRFVTFMQKQIERNRDVYREAVPGIALLHWRGRLAVRISFVLYRAILGEIEKANYDVYKGRVRTSFRQKLWLSARALVGIYE